MKGNFEEALNKCRIIHNGKYDYSRAEEPLKTKDKIKIICPKHGVFLQSLDKHLSGKGCPKCGNENRGKSNTSSTDYFIAKANEIHKNKYDYSKVEYKNAKEKVCIICPEHGEFWQTPNSHLNGSECPKCATMKYTDLALLLAVTRIIPSLLSLLKAAIPTCRALSLRVT